MKNRKTMYALVAAIVLFGLYVNSVDACTGLRLIAKELESKSKLRDQIVSDLAQGQVAEAMQKLTDYLQIWNMVQKNLGSAARLLDIELDSFEIYDCSDPQTPQVLTVGERVKQLIEQLDQVKSAIEAGDLVLMGDIMDYEFPALTETWRDMLEQLADQFEPNQ